MFPFANTHTREAALPLNSSHDSLRGSLRQALRDAHGVMGYSENGPWVDNVFPSHVVYTHNGATQKRSYTVAQGISGASPKVTLGNPSPVHVAYMDTKEAAQWNLFSLKEGAESVFNTLSESATPPELVRETITLDIPDIAEGVANGPIFIPVKIIGPGWGSKAFYSEKMIKESGPAAFPMDTHMYWNHPTATESMEQPERDVNKLAAVFTKTPFWNANGPKGPGLYSEAKIFSDYARQVKEKGPHIGLSIYAGMQSHVGEAEGRTGKIADAFVFTALNSTDFVTKAGAKGAPIVKEDSTTEQENDMDAAQITAMQTENARLKGVNVILVAKENARTAFDQLTAVLKEAKVGDYNVNLLKRVCAAPVLTAEGGIDSEWVKQVAVDFVGGAKAAVTGNGLSQAKESVENQGIEESNKILRESLKALGLDGRQLDAAMGVK